MSFFKYHNYYDSDAVINYSYKSDQQIIHVGRLHKAGLITVVDENGDLQWNKTYSNSDAELAFKKVIRFNEDYIVLGVENGEYPFLLRINPYGEVLWFRSFRDISVKEGIFLENFVNEYMYLGYFDPRLRESGLMFINQEGDVVHKRHITTQQIEDFFEITGLALYGELLFISGNQIIKGEKHGLYLKTDVGLGYLETKYPSSFSGKPITLDGVYFHEKGSTVYISGVADDFPVLLKAEEDFGVRYEEFRNTFTRFALGSDYFYVYTDKNKIVHSDYNFDHQWVKRMDIESITIDQVSDNAPVLHGLHDSMDYSGYMGTDMNSCKTLPEEYFRPGFIEYQKLDGDHGFKDMSYEKSDLELEVIDVPYENEGVCDTGGSTIGFNEFSGLQTPSFYLQAAGSKGEDSAKGIHLRWSLGGKLGENHLPKGNLATTGFNYNKPNDFVKIYRTPYVKSQFKLDFSHSPQLVDDSQKLWVYKFNNDTRIFYVYFKNKQAYTSTRQIINPLQNPLLFIEKYGHEIIEVQCKTDLFFATELDFNNVGNYSALDLESLSVTELNDSQQYLTYRKQLFGQDINSSYFNAENGKTVRFRASDCFVSSIAFEFYSDFIISRNEVQAWKHIGNFSLTIDTDEADRRLEPLPNTNPVHGAWLRYNDDAYVNVDNYRKKWTHPSTGPLDRDIKETVKKYLELSDVQPNPKAYETLSFNFAPTTTDPIVDISTDPPEDGQTQVSNLDILNIAALDYHVARMLGLGHLDIKNDVLDQEFIYIAEYFTNRNLDINNSDKTYQLLSMSLPVSTDIQRLTLPVDLMKLEKGMDSNNPNSSNLYNSEGYSHDGKYRYISIYNYQIPENEIDPVFFSSYLPFDSSSFTTPVYAGLEHRLVKPGQQDEYIWVKPELCHDPQYFNVDLVNPDISMETLPIQIPDTYVPLYMHKQDKTGTYYYKGYGINWFSRAQSGDHELSIETEIKPFNKLLPPSGVTAFNIQKEFPLTFTSQDEQIRLNSISDSDKTLVRLTFDYHIYQDQIGYSVPFDSNISDTTYLTDPNSLFPDNKEVFADDVEIFYRNYTPRIISAQAFQILPHPANQLLAIIRTKDYAVPSSGIVPNPNANQQNSMTPTTFASELPVGTTANDFIGGIFLMNSESYIIHEIAQESTGLTFTVFKKAASDAIIAGNTPTINQSSLILPVINPGTEGLFSVTENMQNTPTWGVKNPNTLKVKIGTNDWSVHRELIYMNQSNGLTQRYLEKSRGIWKNADVEKHYEKIYKYQNSQGDVIEFPDTHPSVHQGVYKITFPGFSMAQHSQFSSGSHSVEWLNGIVRLFTVENYNNGMPSDSRSIFKVVRAENIGTNQDLVLYIYDENFVIEENSSHYPILEEEFPLTTPATPAALRPTDPVTGKNMKVNYYPSYKVYLYKNVSNNLIQDAILPPDGEDVRYSIFGFKSVDNDNTDLQGNKYKSRFSIPAVMFAQRIIEPKQPKQPTGSKYATRPDKFGKSTYSFITEYEQKPYSVQFFRANNSLLLASLYESETLLDIKASLAELGGNDEMFFNDRWINFVDFDMLMNPLSKQYGIFPDTGELQYRLPLPDSKLFFNTINAFIEEHNDFYDLAPGSSNYSEPLADTDRGAIEFDKIIIKPIPNVSGALNFGSFIKERIFNCFLPLTEVPVIYQHIKPLNVLDPAGHRPKNKKQNIRDNNGYLLPPTHSDFDMAPMAAVYSQDSVHSTLFTDFTLDGASDNFYFYGVRELGNQMQMGEFSPFAGPIKLVNTNSAEPPKIMSLLPVVENATLGIDAKVRIEVNPYPEVQQITKIAVYRATNKLDADSVLSMKHIKTVDIADVEVDAVNGSWILYDEFEDLDNKPYSDLLFYRVVVTRKVEYSTTDYNVSPPASQIVVEQAPSLPSKVIVSTLVENYNPPAPELKYHSEPVVSDVINWVILSWEQVCYKGKYHLYKLSNQGNWKEIARIDTDGKNISKAHLYVQEINPSTNTEEWVLNETFDLTGNEFYLPLEKLNLDPMQIKDADGNMLYHHFKMVSQNTSNMLSTQEKILTIYKEDTWADIGGISSDGIEGMITQGTFIVRP